MKRLVLICAIVLSVNTLSAQFSQYFMTPISDEFITLAREVYAVTNAGDTINGDRINSAVLMNGQLRSFVIKKADKSKVKLKAADVKLLAIRASDFMNASSALSAPNLNSAVKIDVRKVMNREWVFFEQALLPTKKDKYALMQLLNVGFSSKIKVYLNPNANETATTSINGIELTGGEDTSYFVVIDDAKSIVCRKMKYNKEALTEIYKDCQVFADNYSGEKFRWSDFSEHVFIYDQLCD